ncbi:hypothetical protein, partial [Nonomuraea sp. NPDC049695]|uniref:hypothetical protein n=1 Tax=Nonomuraea sp. NPDC049695 TaxID=3154734 RepID=UPI00342AD0E0
RPVQDPLGDHELLPLGLDLLQLPGNSSASVSSSLLRAVIRSSSRIPKPSHPRPACRTGQGS